MTKITAGKLLAVAAFLAGAFMTSLDKDAVNWAFFLPVVLVGAVGVWLVKSGEAAAAKDVSALETSRQVLGQSLNQIVERLEELDGRKDAVPTYDMRFEIDRLFRDDLFAFAENRNSMRHLFGLQAYADIMSSFAAGERYINRVWSASTDGYVDEVLLYVARALEQFRHAKTAYEDADKAVA